jgi:hypothetical protein
VRVAAALLYSALSHAAQRAGKALAKARQVVQRQAAASL